MIKEKTNAASVRGESSVLSGVSKSSIKSSMMGVEGAGYDGDSSSTDIMVKYIFPLVAETNRSVYENSVLSLFSFLIVNLQLVLGSMFLFVQYIEIPGIFQTLYNLVFMGLYGERTQIQGKYSAILLIDLAFFASLLLIVIDQAFNHEVKKWEMLVLRHIHGSISVIFVIPNILLVFCALTDLGKESSLTTVYYVISSTISCVYFVYQTMYVYIPLVMTPFIPETSTLLWNPGRLINYVMEMALPMGFCHLFYDFPIRYQYIPPLLLIGLSPFLLSYCLKMHIKSSIIMAIFEATCPSMMTGSILVILKRIGIQIPSTIYFSLPWLVEIASFFIFIFINRSKRATIKNQLSFSSLVNGKKSTDSERKEFFDSLNIDNPDKAIMYLVIGLQNNCELFLDWSLSRYLSLCFSDSNDVLLFLTWFTSFFPSEIHILHTFITSLSRMIEPSIVQKLFYYQLHRVHIFRQSSTSKEANADFAKITKLTENCINEFCKYWFNIANPHGEFNVEVYESIKNIKTDCEAQWADALDKYPNNARFAHEYARFLLDGVCDFKDSIQWHHRALKIEQGQRHANDRLFLRFISAYPYYIKSGIVDKRGNLKIARVEAINQGESISTSTSTSQSFDSSANDDSSDTSQVDNQEIDSFLPQAQLRLALQAAVNSLKSPMVQISLVASIIRLIVSMLFVTIALYLFYPIFDSHINTFSQLTYMNGLESNIQVLGIMGLWHWTGAHYQSNGIPISYYNSIEPTYSQLSSFINYSSAINLTIHNLSMLSYKSLDLISNNLLLKTHDSESVEYGLAALMSSEKITDIRCQQTTAEPNIYEEATTYDSMIRTYLSRYLRISRDTLAQRIDYHNTYYFCELYEYYWILNDFYNRFAMNVSSIYTTEYEKVFVVEEETEEETNSTETEEEEEEEENKVDSVCNFFIAFAPFIILLFTLPSIVYLSVGLIDEKLAFTKVLMSFPHSECLKASERIQKSVVGTKNVTVSQVVSSKSLPEWIINFATAIVVISLIILISLYTQQTNTKVVSLLEQYNLFMEYRNVLFEIGYEVTLLVFENKLLNEGINGTNYSSSFLNITTLIEKIENSLSKYGIIESLLNLGYDGLSPSIGIDSSIDSILFEEQCISTDVSKSPIDFYKCISFQRVLSYYIEQTKSLYSSYEKKSPDSNTIGYLTHLLLSRVANGFTTLLSSYQTVFTSSIDSFHILVVICFIISLFFIVASFMIDLFVLGTIKSQLNTFKTIMLRLNPIAFVAHPVAVSLIHGGNSNSDSTIISAAHAVFQTSHDAMILLNEDSIIESINPSATTIFRFTPEQMLGQSLKFIIPQDNPANSSLYYTMQLMKSGQCALIFETELSGVKDDGSTVSLKVTLLGFASNGRVADSFALMCKDQTEEMRQKQAVQEAKKQSETLLHQILPKDIITRLNRGDKEISFTVPSSTIIFIDIVQFSTYMATLTASQLMQNLSAVFTAFDQIVATLPIITKIKLIGDVYMAAGGLFHHDHNPKEHAVQMVQFGLRALDAIEELNEQLNANLQVRIGINTGGPLIAGVLGTEKPLFDIIGDPINVAARLQSTCIPGLIQISQGTYDLIAGESFNIEQRGEVELKGKGKQMTYLIHPNTPPSEKVNTALFEVAEDEKK